MQDLSHMAKGLVVSSMEAGNMVADNSPAMTAPGSEPVTPMPARQAEGKPDPEPSGPQVKVGTQKQPGKSYAPTSPQWKAAG